MSKKYSFPEPGCSSCSQHQKVGNCLCNTRYCHGFKRRKPKRFRNSDPAYKAPKWCPKRITPPICRIYGFKDEQSGFMENFWKRQSDNHIPSPSHYKLRQEISLGLTAKLFYEEAQMNPLHKIFPPGEKIESGEIVEIDDGLQPYYFYISDYGTVTPLRFFQMYEEK